MSATKVIGSVAAPSILAGPTFRTPLSVAKPFATDNGVLNVGPANMEGAATLPITLVADTIYTVQMDVTSNAAEWVGIGFSERPSATTDDGEIMNPNRPQDRFAQSGGRAWMLIRPGEVDQRHSQCKLKFSAVVPLVPAPRT